MTSISMISRTGTARQKNSGTVPGNEGGPREPAHAHRSIFLFCLVLFRNVDRINIRIDQAVKR